MALHSGVVSASNMQHSGNINNMPIHKKTEVHHSLKNEAISALELSNRLHSTLDLEKLLDIYCNESSKKVSFDNLSYKHPTEPFSYESGNRKRHSCQYRLLMGGQNLGEIEFTRSSKFTDDDTIQLEYLLSTLLNPLHNSLMYRQAVINAQIDPLTGVNNRTSYDTCINREISLASRHKNDIALLVVDIDKFKGINDEYGHLFGDCVLRDVAKRIHDCVRNSDMVFRYGGEEFVIILSNTTQKGALLLAERIRSSIEKMTCEYGGNSTSVTVSQGIACRQSNETGEQLFDRADKALYESKHHGRNQSTLAE